MNLEPLPNGLVRVTFEWDPRFGECYDCGAPAAYIRGLVPVNPTSVPEKLLCSVCAAIAASEGGETITWLFAEEYT